MKCSAQILGTQIGVILILIPTSGNVIGRFFDDTCSLNYVIGPRIPQRVNHFEAALGGGRSPGAPSLLEDL